MTGADQCLPGEYGQENGMGYGDGWETGVINRHEESLGMMNMFILLIVMITLQVYICQNLSHCTL